MISIIWFFLVGVGILYGIVSGHVDSVNSLVLNGVGDGISLIMNIMPVIILWMGIMKIASNSGLLDKLSNLMRPFFIKLFPSLKSDSKAISYVASNVVANMMGLGSAATPFGLKAMEEMQKENDNKEVASDAMITFLVLNTAGVTIIPTTVIGLRTIYGSLAPSSIIIPSVIATSLASISGLLIDYIIRRRK